MTQERSKLGIVERLADKGFVPPDDWSERSITIAEVRRLRRGALMGCFAAQIPRRVGEGNSNNLAADKFISKSIGYTYWTLWKRMVIAKHAPLRGEDLSEEEMYLYPPDSWNLLRVRAYDSEEIRQAAMTVIWVTWWDELRPRLRARQKAIATFALREGNISWGYRILTSMDSEISWIETKFMQWASRYGEAA